MSEEIVVDGDDEDAEMEDDPAADEDDDNDDADDDDDDEESGGGTGVSGFGRSGAFRAMQSTHARAPRRRRAEALVSDTANRVKCETGRN